MKTVLTTADIAARKRFQFWQDAVCDTFVELDCQAGVEDAFFGEITTADCEGLHFSTVRSDSQIVKRTRTRIRRAREEVMLISLQVRGIGVVAQDGREARLQPGDFACYDSTRPYTLNFDASFEQLVLHMPREAMMRRIGRTELWTARRIEGASPVGSLVLPFVQRTASIVSDIAPATASRLSETCLSLVTAALGERLSEIGHGASSVRTALVFRIRLRVGPAIAQGCRYGRRRPQERDADLALCRPWPWRRRRPIYERGRSSGGISLFRRRRGGESVVDNAERIHSVDCLDRLNRLFLVAQVKRLARVLRMRLEVELDALLLEHRDKLHHRVAPGGLAGLVGELSDAAVCRVPRSGEGPRPNSEFIVSTPISTAISTAILQ